MPMRDGTDSLYRTFGMLVQTHRRRIKGMTQGETRAAHWPVPDVGDQH